MAKGKDAQVDVASVFKDRRRIGDIDVVFKFVPGMQAGQMRGLCDQLRELSQSLLVFLVNAEPAGGFIVCASQALSKQLDLKAMIGALDEQNDLSCRGGGSPHLLQGKVVAGECDRDSFHRVGARSAREINGNHCSKIWWYFIG